MSKIKDILSEIGYSNIIDNGKEYRMRPIYRDSGNNTSLKVDKKSGSFIDFSANIKGPFSELIKLTLNLKSSKEAQKWISGKGISIDHKSSDQKPEIKHQRTYPLEYLEKLKPIHDYWIKRGIPLDVIKLFRGGVAGTGRMKGRYVFPIFNSSKSIVGFSGRDLLVSKNSDYSRPKWKHYGEKAKWKYPLHVNYREVKERKKVILVESIGDMLALWNAGYKHSLVIFGVDVSVEVINVLLKVDPDKIFICLNNDSEKSNAGNVAAEKIQFKLRKYFDTHQIKIKLPTKNDFGDMSKEEITNWANG